MILQLLLFASMAWSQTTLVSPHGGNVFIKNADEMYSDRVKKTMRLEGHVRVMFHGQLLACDKAFINDGDQTILAEGHVILESMKVHMEGTSMRFNYQTNTGIIENGYVQSGQVIFQGEWINKTGPETYVAQNAEYTACNTCPPGWAFSGQTIEAEIGGYAYIQRPIFKVGGVPIFIFPAMTVPLKSTRQTGFLVPSMEFTGLGGAGIEDSFFWAIDKSRDLTLTGVYWQKRAPQFLEDYRYILSPDSSGRMQGSFMSSDRMLANEYALPKPENRWYMRYQHQFDLPDDYVNRLEINQISDLRYPRDFPEEMPGQGDPALENHLSVTKNTETNAFSAEAVLNENLLKYEPYSDNTDAVNKMPEIRYSGRERRVLDENWGPLVRWDLDYVNFARDQYSYDSLMPDPQFPSYLTGNVNNNVGIVHQPFSGPAGTTSMLRTGQRLDVSPTVSYPFQIAKLFDVLPTATYHEMQYRFNLPEGAEADGYDSTAARRYFETSVTARTEIESTFGDLNDEKSDRWNHSFVPELSYDEIPWMRSPNDPFFGNWNTSPYYLQNYPITDSDVNGPNKLQFDYYDRVFNRKLTTLALNNYFTNKTWTNGDSIYKRIAMFRIQQSYDFVQENAGAHQPWSPTDVLFNAAFKNFESYSTISYNRYADVTSVFLSGKLKLDEKRFIRLNYNHSYLIDELNQVQTGSETRSYGVGVGYTQTYFDIVTDVNYGTMPTRGIQSFDITTNLRPPGNCWHFTVVGTQYFGTGTSWHFNFAFDFSGGAKPAASNTSPGTDAGSTQI